MTLSAVPPHAPDHARSAPGDATRAPGHAPEPGRVTAPVLDVVVPVHNEEIDLEPCVERLHGYLTAEFPYRFRITIADNASTDSTADVARRLAGSLPGVSAVHLPEKGRGRALKHVWTRSDATVLAYLDVDLSTDLGALLPLVAPLISGHSDLAIGSRLARGSRVVRGPKREFISRGYNLILRGTLAARFSDAQCGFKAVRSDVAARLLPMVEDTGWFFDTEMLVLAERAGLRIHEVPVDWVDDPDSRVDIVATAMADLRGIARLVRGLGTGRLPLAALREQLGRDPLPVAGVPAGLTGQLLRFAAVGVTSTLAYLVLFAVLRTGVGPQWANLAALLITAVANTAANRKVTFRVRGPGGAWRQQAQGLVVFAVGLGLTSGSLAVLHALTEPPTGLELTVLVAANLIATGVRFLLMRNWVFGVARNGNEHNPRNGMNSVTHG
ncbi:sugar translocase [Actinoplanes sp. NBRC 14428]|uniref:dolichyl-phosphate beta-glucosyltransferase n=1 Tax=Pseudosporangium ferrugineum TaxID=439699 RepID=A0A2T0RML7_9ACTN|nr:bifunctional glycosyltransferase family 2/GtrA family protein [Pseudosporangium ferrugineum]PRY22363.1 glycosyltransferase involved in cell wall biosynthesis [Pseudosporangium ferrugineum]BCJ52487.1 sugar translocase [Actinoplanes sp. NBRC 14428]